MKIYIDTEYKCHTEPADGLTAVETDFFDGKCKTFIEGYRFVPEGQEWTREDGVVFKGEMIAPWKDYTMLAAAQQGYEEAQAVPATDEEKEDMKSALETLGVNVDG